MGVGVALDGGPASVKQCWGQNPKGEVGICHRLNCVPPKKCLLVSSSPVLLNVTLSWDRVFTEVIKLK